MSNPQEGCGQIPATFINAEQKIQAGLAAFSIANIANIVPKGNRQLWAATIAV